MNTLKTLSLAFICAILIREIGGAKAEQVKQFGDYVIHYNTVNTEFLEPQVARLYGITRSSNRAILTVTVLKEDLGKAAVSVKAQVSASAVNLSNQIRAMSMREIIDGDAIYYVGEFPITDRETLDFNLQVSTDSGATHTLAFRQQFFTN
jgi:hypothetical protein